MSMTIEEIRTSVTMALCKSVITEDNSFIMNIEEDVKKQCDVVGEHLSRHNVVDVAVHFHHFH